MSLGFFFFFFEAKPVLLMKSPLLMGAWQAGGRTARPEGLGFIPLSGGEDETRRPAPSFLQRLPPSSEPFIIQDPVPVLPESFLPRANWRVPRLQPEPRRGQPGPRGASSALLQAVHSRGPPEPFTFNRICLQIKAEWKVQPGPREGRPCPRSRRRGLWGCGDWGHLTTLPPGR